VCLNFHGQSNTEESISRDHLALITDLIKGWKVSRSDQFLAKVEGKLNFLLEITGFFHSTNQIRAARPEKTGQSDQRDPEEN
jgi:hypothetical protein